MPLSQSKNGMHPTRDTRAFIYFTLKGGRVMPGVRCFRIMTPEVQKAIANLDGISSVDDPDELQKLDDTIQRLLDSEGAELGIDALLRVLERFPTKDGYGIFWGIVHGLESLPGYEVRLLESVRRQPSLFSLLMVNRILNAGIAEVNGVNLLTVLKEVAADEMQPEEIREDARDSIECQEGEK
jgi:hypothetical protein